MYLIYLCSSWLNGIYMFMCVHCYETQKENKKENLRGSCYDSNMNLHKATAVNLSKTQNSQTRLYALIVANLDTYILLWTMTHSTHTDTPLHWYMYSFPELFMALAHKYFSLLKRFMSYNRKHAFYTYTKNKRRRSAVQ